MRHQSGFQRSVWLRFFHVRCVSGVFCAMVLFRLQGEPKSSFVRAFVRSVFLFVPSFLCVGEDEQPLKAGGC